jgi:hypothetical protein
MRKLPLPLLSLVAVTAVLGAGCGAETSPSSKAAAAPTPKCPAAWRAGWQQLANQIGTLVYCPSWMPRPLDGKIQGSYGNGRSVSKDGSYLVSFVWIERGYGGIAAEVHVNFRAYPGRTALPVCEDLLTVKGKTVRKTIPCFADPRGTRRIHGITATVYTANQGADAWHVLYAWRRQGSLYAISEHVAPPYTYRQVVQHLDRMLRGLVPVEPST